jgi:hypothetical protein
MRGVFESEGDIRSVDLLSALVALWREKAGGALRFSRPGTTAGFDISGGDVTATLSSQAQFDAAAILIRAAKLDPAAVERLTMPEGSDAALAAMQAGLLTAREWRWGRKIRAIEILSDLLGWLEGEYVFERGEPAPAGDWTLPLPRLVLELFLRSRDRTLVEHYLGPSDLPLLRAGSFDEEFETFGLTADADSVVRLIDGKASAEEIAEKSPADEFAVMKLLAALTTLGLVAPAEAAPAAAPRRPVAPRAEPRGRPEPPPPPEPPGKREEEAAPEAEWEAPPETEPTPEEEALPETGRETGGEGELDSKAGSFEPQEQEEIEPTPLARREPEEPAQAPLRAPEPEPVAEPDPRLAGQARGPIETEFPLASHEEAVDRALAFPGGGEPPSQPPKSGSGVVLAVLLAALLIAVTTLVIVRARRSSSDEKAAATNLRVTERENPVFPPAETAVPLPGHGRGAGPPSPVRTAAVALPLTSGPTALPMAARPPTGVPTRFQPTSPATRVPTIPVPTKPPTLVPTRPEPTKSPTLVPTRPEPTKSPTLVPTRPEPTKPPTRVPTRPEPTKPPTRVPTRPEPTRPPALTAPPTAVAVARRELTREDWIRRAERDKSSLAKRRNARYSVQLELACELPTLENALNWDRPPGTIWFVPSTYRGRTCFRVLWGRYGSLAEARAAKTRVPEFFTAPGNRPAVVSIR